jgi:hypothetical protein
MNKNDLISRVASLISDEMDGDTVLLIEQHLPNVLAEVCRTVAELKPTGHHELVYENIINDSDLDQLQAYPSLDLSTQVSPQIVVQNRLHHVEFLNEDTGILYPAYPVSTIESLSLASAHGKNYYFIRYPYMYFAYVAPLLTAASFKINLHQYIYASITQFPEELSDILVMSMVKLMQNEAAKQASEELKP